MAADDPKDVVPEPAARLCDARHRAPFTDGSRSMDALGSRHVRGLVARNRNGIRGSIVRRDISREETTWIASINSTGLGEFLEREIAMRRVEERASRAWRWRCTSGRERIMRGRVRLFSDYSEIKIRSKFAPNSVAPNFEPDWNKPPTAPMLVAIRSVNGERVPKMMKWA
jgi:hypothetical protein